MAVILKIENEHSNTNIEIYPFNKDRLLSIWMQEDYEYRGINLDEDEVKELIVFLQKQLQSVS